MMTSYKAGAQTGSNGCGCGGSSASNCGCGNGTASYSQPAHSTTFLRPRFFPGQLLTEDDLEQLVSYTVAKNRLHNRFLFGEGVVAGLQVHKHPNLNSKGFIRVSAGYALDSQGNDLVVPCPHDLDINKLVRDLVQARMGRECEPVLPPVVDRIGKPQAAREGVAEEPTPKPTRRYALYLRYHEQPTEPTAPYTTGEDACAAQSCQFARVQEGYLFELRCYEGPPERSGFLEALAKCGTGPERAVRAEDLEWLARRAREMRQAVQRLPAVAVAVEGQLRGNYVLTQQDLAAAEELSKAGYTPNMSVKEGALRLENMASLVARYDMRSNPQQTHESFEALRARIQGEGGAGLADKVLTDAQSADLSPLERKTVTTIAQMARRWTRAERGEGWGTSSEHRLLAAGTVLNPELQAEYQTVTRGVLKGTDTQVARPVEAQERKAAAVGTAPRPVPADLEDSEIRYTAASLEQLAGEYQKLQRECMCEAIHPPFAPPGDPAVLLARLDVRECEIVDICNMERQLVLSPAAAQYWVGSALREQLENACCGPRDGELGDRKRASAMLEALVRMYGGSQATTSATPAPAASGTLRSSAEGTRRVVQREGTTEARPAPPPVTPEPAPPSEASAAKAGPVASEPGSRDETPVTPSPGRTTRRGGSRGGGRRG